MSGHHFGALIALTIIPYPVFAESLAHFDPQHNTWNATNIVVTEGGRVIECWKGDLKVGDTLPEGAARYSRIAVPGQDPRQLRNGEKLVAVSGKRMVLFLSYVPQEGQDPRKLVWMGAYAPGYPSDELTKTSVAWIEGERIYHVTASSTGKGYALKEDGGIAGLKQRVDLGIALRAQFDAATADKDRERRAERIVALSPTVLQYAGYIGLCNCVRQLGKCGKAAVPYLTNWVTEPKAEFANNALSTLCWLGDEGFDGMWKILDAEIKYWKAAANRLNPGDWVDQLPHTDLIHRWRGPHRLRSILHAAHGMKLSAENRQRLANHAGLIELEKILRTKQGMKPEKTYMEEAHAILQDILAGKFRKEE